MYIQFCLFVKCIWKIVTGCWLWKVAKLTLSKKFILSAVLMYTSQPSQLTYNEFRLLICLIDQGELTAQLSQESKLCDCNKASYNSLNTYTPVEQASKHMSSCMAFMITSIRHFSSFLNNNCENSNKSYSSGITKQLVANCYRNFLAIANL